VVAPLTVACVANEESSHSNGRVAISASRLIERQGSHIHKTESENCLVARAGAGERPVEQTPCKDKFTDQDWELIDIDRAGCIVARGMGAEARAVTTTCKYDRRFPDQLWFAWSDGSGIVQFENVNSHLCLAARSNSPAIQTHCDFDFGQY
jgi:hypothetical protein